jgi:hypothetical protein
VTLDKPGGWTADHRCPSCNTPQAEGAVVCIACGYDSRTGEIIDVTIDRSPPEPRPEADPDAIVCPRCGLPIRRATDCEGEGSGCMAHPFSALIYQALASVVCPMCGMIPRKEFPPHVARRLLRESIRLIGFAFLSLGLVVGASAFLVFCTQSCRSGGAG